jgi:hypothetical protein
MGVVGSSRYLAHDDVPEAMKSDDISIHTTEEMEKYKSLHRQEFAHTHIYDVNLLERVGLDEEPPTILWTIGWGKLYDERHQGSHQGLDKELPTIIKVWMRSFPPSSGPLSFVQLLK